VRSLGLAIVLAFVAATLASCGGSGSTVVTRTATNLIPAQPPPSLTFADCGRLTRAVRNAIGAAGGDARIRLHRSAQPQPRLSGCSYTGAGARVSFRIDTAHDSRQRFSNRNVEAVQFSFDEPQRRPRDVPGVGDRGAEYKGATWTPASREMLAIRGNRLLILDLYVQGASSTASRAAAAQLARRVYAGSASRR
jgi:hypothetical protein